MDSSTPKRRYVVNVNRSRSSKTWSHWLRTAVGLAGFGSWAGLQLASGKRMDERYGVQSRRWFGTEIALFDIASCIALCREAFGGAQQHSAAHQMRDICGLLTVGHLVQSARDDSRTQLHLLSGALTALYAIWWRS
jgi:hypothetical protein